MAALLFALVFLIAATGHAQAGFLIPAIVAAIGLTGVAASVATFIGTVALSVGISWAASKLMPKPDQAKAAGGVELDIRIDAELPQSLLVGRAVTAGSLIYAETYGKREEIDNSDMIEVISIADHPCEGLVKVFVAEKEATLTPAGSGIPGQWWGPLAQSRGDTVNGYNNKLAIKFYDGSQTTADPFAVAAVGNHPERPWTSAFIGRGTTYARVHSIYGATLVPGPMRWRFVVDGIRLYDPRKDTTVGGSGSHRFGTLSTHEFTANLAVIAYNILRGIRVLDVNGVAQHFYGLEGTAAANLPLDNWFAAMNECDATVDGEPQFHGGAEISVDTEPLEAIRQMLSAMDGRLTEIGGVYKLYVGVPGVPVFAIDDDVIRANEGDEFRPIMPLEQRVNHVTGSYTSPEDGWIPKVAPSRRVIEWEE
ncbi:MAG: hypothetical protein GEU95_26890, partial [Rhizobiales bacterium]|nr:hypothetical protein [Hyphomicrobiales bacterium]